MTADHHHDDEPSTTEPGFVAYQAETIDAALDLVDYGAFAKRAVPGERYSERPTVSTVDQRLRRDRVNMLLWRFHSRCPGHPVEDHRFDAESAIDVLFPPSLFD